MTDGALGLKVWRTHPDGCPIVPADRTLRNTANPDAARWCGPFTHANKAGWWVFPPVDVDITWRGGSEFDYELLTPYSNADGKLITFLLDEERKSRASSWMTDPDGGRTKFTWGKVEPGVVQIYTGCIFQTPPQWGLHIRSPINCPHPGVRVMEAMLETDWLYYDIWLNVAFERVDERVELRRDGWPPLAQLVPVRRESYESTWGFEEELINRNSGEADKIFGYYVDYNEKKFVRGGKQLRTADASVTKDSTTYYRERRRLRSAP